MAAVCEEFSEHGDECACLGLRATVQISIKGQMLLPFYHNVTHRAPRVVLTS